MLKYYQLLIYILYAVNVTFQVSAIYLFCVPEQSYIDMNKECKRYDPRNFFCFRNK